MKTPFRLFLRNITGTGRNGDNHQGRGRSLTDAVSSEADKKEQNRHLSPKTVRQLIDEYQSEYHGVSLPDANAKVPPIGLFM